MPHPISLPQPISALCLLLVLGPTLTLPSRADADGPSSRRTAWAITEVMFHPADRADARNGEFVEILNTSLITEDLGRHRLSGEVTYEFPPNTLVPAGGRVVVAPVPNDVQAIHGIGQVLGGFSQRLSNAGGTLRLENPAGAVLLEVNYHPDPPWPAAAAGGGHSLVLRRPSFGERDPRAWGISTRIGGSPGAAEPASNPAFQSILINEIRARSAAPLEDFIELHNHAATARDLAGCRLTDNPARPGLTLPSPSVIGPGGFLAFTQSQLGFALAAEGETIFLLSPDGTQVIDALRFGPQSSGIAFGRSPDAAPLWSALGEATPGSANAPRTQPPVIIHEIMYHPITDDDDDEYLELFNPGDAPVSLAGWRFVDGITFEFPAGATIAAGGYVVVARNSNRILANHPQLQPALVFGEYQGSLADGGERIALARPETLTTTLDSGISTQTMVHVVVSEVTYHDGGRWGRWSDGGGSSLELIDPRGDPRLPDLWADSDESRKAPWSTIESTGTLDLGSGAIDQLQLLAQGAGTYLVDDVEVHGPTSANLVANGAFSSGTSGWIFQGTQSGSQWEPAEGASAPGCLRVHAVARGDTGANRIRTALSATLSPGSTATLRARVRWLNGPPEFLMRLRGNYLEAAGPLNVPRNLGTPGAPNSRAVPNAPPAISEILHTPILPAANQSVVVTARIHDPDPVAQVRLRYRVDPATAVLEIPMLDDGTAPDLVRGDGIYSATIAGRPTGSLIAYRVVATDSHPTPATRTEPTEEALIRFGEIRPPGALGTYRLWLTQATFNEWTSRAKLDNTPLPVTFVYNDERVIHGVGALFAGSPHLSPGYSTPSGNLCGYVVIFPPDDPFLGASDVVLDWPGRDTTAQQEPMAYWIARELGIPFNHRRYIRLHVNGVTETARGSVYEDAQQVNSDLIESWNPNGTGGDLFKIEQWFEYADNLATIQIGPPRLALYSTTGGARKLAAYRWSWLKRAVRNSANDYRTLLTLADAANAPDPEVFHRQMDAFADLEEWMRIFATENIIVNFDAWGYDIGKNMYAYKPPGQKWQLHMWDIDWVMLASAQHRYSPRSPLMYSGPAVFGDGNRDPTVGRLYAHPPFQRAYWRAIEDAVNGPLLPERFNTRLDATHAALVANTVTRSSGGALANPVAVKSWLQQRREFLLEQLATVDAPFQLLPPPPSVTGSNLVHLTGTAPVAVRDLLLNGRPYPVQWTTVTQWRLEVPLQPGTNDLSLQARNRLGQLIPGASAAARIVCHLEPDPATSALALNEIQYQPRVPGAAFVEFLNRSAHTTFDLSGWQIGGTGLDLPIGTLLTPGAFLLLASDRQSLAEEHGIRPIVDAEFPGTLLDSGETISLREPAIPPAAPRPVVEVTYDTVPPWPAPASGSGFSIQLVDPTQDPRRPANWATSPSSSSAPPQTLIPMSQSWRFPLPGQDPGSAWTQPGFDDSSWRTGGALLYVESADLPFPKVTPLTRGAITYYFRTRFLAEFNPAQVDLNLATVIDDGAIVYLNGQEILRLGMPAGPVTSATVANRTVSDATLEGPFRIPSSALRPGENILAVEVHQISADSSDIVFGLSLDTVPRAFATATPDAPNATGQSLPTLAPLWINEFQPQNLSGPRDAAGDRDPWVELFNAGTQPVSLDSLHLSDSITNPARWRFPAGLEIPPGGHFLVWLDGEPTEATPTEPHTTFRIPDSQGSLLLSQVADGRAYVLDALHYAGVAPDHSIALVPDGDPHQRFTLPAPTPGTSNQPAAPPVSVVINEWMASNTSAVPDPADGDFDDWFELFNPASTPADLSGHFLSDDPTRPFKFALPPGSVLGPRAFLLVWADEEGEQFLPGSDLHANFRLSQAAESIGLYAPNGSPIDVVTYRDAPSNRTQGRWPDGGPVSTAALSLPTPRAANAPPAGLDPRPTLLGIASSGGDSWTLTWSATPGTAYRVQTRADWSTGSWREVTESLVATDTTLTVTVPGTTENRQGYFRILALPRN